MKQVKRRCVIKKFVTENRPFRIQCGIKRRRKEFSEETVLIAVPLSEDKLFCFPSLVQCLKHLLETTKAKCVVAFALNAEDEGMAEAVKDCGIPHIIIPAERPDELPADFLDQFTMGISDFTNYEMLLADQGHYWVNCITFARNALRTHAISNNFDWLFFLDSDTVIEPNGLNRLLSYGTDTASVYCRNRLSVERGYADGVSLVIGRGLEQPPYRAVIHYEDAIKFPTPIFNAYPCTAAGLIHKRVFKTLHYHFGFVPLERGEKPGVDSNCTEAGRFLSEDMMFGYEAAQQGFTSVICHKTKSIHFIEETDYPKGFSNRLKSVSYEEYISPESSQNGAATQAAVR